MTKSSVKESFHISPSILYIYTQYMCFIGKMEEASHSAMKIFPFQYFCLSCILNKLKRKVRYQISSEINFILTVKENSGVFII